MQPDTLVFSVEGEPYSWRDVILSAVQRGDWRAAEQRARQGAACARLVEATGEGLPPGTLDAAGREFRYAHDLVTAQSMEEWLARHGLSVQEWTACLRRTLLRARASLNLDDLADEYPISHEDAVRLALVDAVCSSELATWARALAERAAAHAYLHAYLHVGEPPPSGAAHARTTEAIDTSPLTILWGDDPATLHVAVRRLQQLDESLDGFRTALLTERAVQDYISTRQLDWVRFDCRIMAFPNAGMAAEAALLLREDGEGFTSVYQVAHTEPRAAQFFLDQIEDSLRDHFLGSRPGDLIGPVHVDDEFLLYQVEEKVLPTIRDADVRRRAEDGVLSAALDQQLERHVDWRRAT
ncbi:MAG: hypothetical protein ABIT20_06620 [Gemmatimonadaceae bacterium]